MKKFCGDLSRKISEQREHFKSSFIRAQLRSGNQKYYKTNFILVTNSKYFINIKQVNIRASVLFPEPLLCFTIQFHNTETNMFLTLNDLTIGWLNLNSLSHPNATLAPQARPSCEILNYLLSCQSDILVRLLPLLENQHLQKKSYP